MAEHQELLSAIQAVKEAPSESSHWDRVEELVDSVQRPTDVSELFRAVLHQDIDANLASDIGQRAVRFYEAWYGEDSTELPEMLERVLFIDPRAEWAFQRLTVAYTVAEKWDALLGAYERAIEHADSTMRRMQLLEEAAQTAKDFANMPDRAIGYMTRLIALDPGNASLASSLERLLERQERYSDLVALHEARMAAQSKSQVRETRVRMASVHLHRLKDAGSALAQLKTALSEVADYQPALEVVQEILSESTAPPEIRDDSLRILKRYHLSAGNRNDVIRVLEESLDFATGPARTAALRELVDRLVALNQDARAMPYQAALLTLEPTPKEREGLLALAQRTRDYEQYQSALRDAAKDAEPAVALELQMEAGRTLEQDVGDIVRAIDCYGQVFVAPPGEFTIEAGRRLIALLEHTEREPETLEACSRLADLEQDDDLRRRLLGKVARLAEKLGDEERARRAWQARVGEDTADVEALDALIRAAESHEEWPRLAELLTTRIKAPGAAERRRDDLRWLSSVLSEHLHDLDGAIAAWREIQRTFGEDNETVNALTDLLSRAERWQELADVLKQAAAHEIARFTELQAQLGDAFRLRLSRPMDAAHRYRSALQVDPAHGVARAGQTALLEDADCRGVAADSLAEAYQQNDEWQLLLGLLEPRLSTEESDTVKAELLIEAANLYEERADDPAAALGCLRRAFALIPDDRGTERDIRRLAERLSAWEAVVEAYRETIASFPRPTPRVAELRFDEGEVLEQRVGDTDAALVAYRQGADVAPDRMEFALSEIRLAGALGKYEQIARRVVACAAARQQAEPELYAAVIAAVTDASGWDSLTRALMDALPSAALPPALARDLYCWVARFQREQRQDLAAAEAALSLATAADPDDVSTLKLLAEVQRAEPSEALIDTLVKVADKEPRNLDTLQEACDVALEHLGARELALPILLRLYETAASMFKHATEASGECDSQSTVIWALERLVQLYSDGGDKRRALDLLCEAAALPFDSEAVQGLRHDAARMAAEGVSDTLRAIELYRDILQLDPRDAVAIERLSALYKAEDRMPELLMLRHHELSLQPEPERCLALRLDIAAILGDMEARGGRVQSLEVNLSQHPGHRASLDALTQVLRGKGQFAELAAIVETQARRLTKSQEFARAAELWRDVAVLHELELSDLEAALSAYRELHTLEPNGDATEALSRLHAQRGEHAKAAEWLELRLGTVKTAERPKTALALARAHVAAEQFERARGCLEQLLAQDPGQLEARALLADLYRRADNYGALSRLLLGGVEHVRNDDEKLALLTEVADLHHGPLGTPEEAITALQRAQTLDPDEDRLGIMLAKSLRAAERYDEAAVVLQQLIDSFGRKRSPGRAELHYQLASVLAVGGDREGALTELETATKMDLAHAPALHMAAQLSYAGGDLDRSERAYRGLLMLVRRQQSDDLSEVGPSEVFYALHGIAVQRGQEEQAAELLQSALEAAAQSDAEAQRFQRVTQAADAELLLQVLDLRLDKVSNPIAEAEIRVSRADVLDSKLGRSEEAFEVLLNALPLNPGGEELHRAARQLAMRVEGMQRYLDACSRLSEQLGERSSVTDRRMSVALLLRMGEAIEQGMGDLDRAAALYSRVEASGDYQVEAWLALARVAGARGQEGEQRRVLQRISELADTDASDARGDAFYALSELSVAQPDHVDEAVSYLEKALSIAPDYPRAKSILERLLRTAPDHKAALQMVYRVAHEQRDDALLLEWHRRTAALPGAKLSQIRDGVELAQRLDATTQAEALLQCAARLAEDNDGESSTWIYTGLAQCRLREGDVPGAMSGLRTAIQQAAGEDAFRLRRQLAELASGEGGDLAVAAEAYEGLLERDPGEREVWTPLMAIYRKRADEEGFSRFVARAQQELLSDEDRGYLLLSQARFLIDIQEDENAAAEPLSQLLSEQPGHGEATDLLMGIYQRQGMNKQLSHLLMQQFDRARDEQNVPAVAELGLRLGSLYANNHPEEAASIYRSALEWAPLHVGLLRASAAVMPADADPRERAELMHARLKAKDPEAVPLIEPLCTLWQELGEQERAQEALEYGYALDPQNQQLRKQLEAHYREHALWRPLSQLFQTAAASTSDPAEAVAGHRAAAELLRDRLGDLPAAADALRAALALAPEDLALLGELSQCLAAAGQTEEAVEDVNGLLERHAEPDDNRLNLLRVRASLLRKLERHADAVNDLEEAYSIDRERVVTELIDGLEVLKGQAFVRGDRSQERATTLRLVKLHDAAGAPDAARELLSQWCETESSDVDALRALRRRDELDERYHDVATVCERLLELEEGEARVEAALGLVDAYERTGRPEGARVGLERAYRDMPDNGMLRSRLMQLYEAQGEKAPLATILMQQGDETAASASTRIGHYQRAATLYLELDDAKSALSALARARELDPEDKQNELLMIDIQIKLGQFDDARAVLESAMEAHKRKRSPELASLQQRMARLCATLGDTASQLQWLQQALDTDRKSAEIAAEIVEVAVADEDYEAAMKALRSITMMEDPRPITRAMAFLKQAQIAVVRGDTRRAQHWARKAKSLDSSLTEAEALLVEIG